MISVRLRRASTLASALARPPSRQPPAWRRLAESLKDEGCDSIYLDRLRTSFDPSSHVQKLEEELIEEMARALANTAAKANYHFAKLDLCDKKMREAESSNFAEAAQAFNAQREICVRARQDLLIHRQALGFKTQNHRAVESDFPLPPRVNIDLAEDAPPS